MPPENYQQRIVHMDLPLFPLNFVLFPGQVQHLHIFEPRYREMINYCVDHNHPFGVVLTKKSKNVAGKTIPHNIGTAARIVGLERLDDGRMIIATVGTKRFYIDKVSYDRSYLTGEVRSYPVINGGTKKATTLAQQVRPRIMAYVNLIAEASRSQLPLKRLPEDPTSLAFLIAMALQIGSDEKQKLLSLPGIPQMLAREDYLLQREGLLLQHQIETQDAVQAMSSGPTGYIFPN